jgi:hypothetical protein
MEDLRVLEDLVGQFDASVPFLRSRSSVCILDQKDSIIALSKASPTVPSEGIRPADWTRWVKLEDVNFTP